MRKSVSAPGACLGLIALAGTCMGHAAVPQEEMLHLSGGLGFGTRHEYQNELTSTEVPRYITVLKVNFFPSHCESSALNFRQVKFYLFVFHVNRNSRDTRGSYFPYSSATDSQLPTLKLIISMIARYIKDKQILYKPVNLK